jgi:pentapeptide MXKDX repeat protein
MKNLSRLVLPLILATFAVSGASAQDSMKKMDAMKSDPAMADCMKKAKMEKSSAKMAMMEKDCTSKASMMKGGAMKK